MSDKPLTIDEARRLLNAAVYRAGDLIGNANGDAGTVRSEIFNAVSDLLIADRRERIVDLWITCPRCKTPHVDEGEFAEKPHHTHACQSCGLTWRPAIGPTRGVKFLPGFKN